MMEDYDSEDEDRMPGQTPSRRWTKQEDDTLAKAVQTYQVRAPNPLPKRESQTITPKKNGPSHPIFLIVVWVRMQRNKEFRNVCSGRLWSCRPSIATQHCRANDGNSSMLFSGFKQCKFDSLPTVATATPLTVCSGSKMVTWSRFGCQTGPPKPGCGVSFAFWRCLRSTIGFACVTGIRCVL